MIFIRIKGIAEDIWQCVKIVTKREENRKGLMEMARKSTVIRIYDESTGELLQKQCSKCKEIKDVSEFYKRPRASDGLRSKCKGCMKERYENNKEHYKEHYENNKEHYKEYQKEYREANKEYYKEHYKEYRQTPEGKAARKRANHKHRTKKKGNGGSYTSEQWNQCLDYFNHCDAYTGEPLESTEIEHIIPVDKGGTTYIYNLVPANRSTNASKRNKDIFEWYSKQEYFSWERYIKICMWIIKNM